MKWRGNYPDSEVREERLNAPALLRKFVEERERRRPQRRKVDHLQELLGLLDEQRMRWQRKPLEIMNVTIMRRDLLKLMGRGGLVQSATQVRYNEERIQELKTPKAVLEFLEEVVSDADHYWSYEKRRLGKK